LTESTGVSVPTLPGGETAGGRVVAPVEGYTYSLDDLSDSSRSSFEKYEKSGWKGNYSGQTPGTAAGGKYWNNDGILPATDSNGNVITYREYDVNNYIEGQIRDAERFVVGSDGSIYFTDSHYGYGVSPSNLPPFIKIK
jgi:hypothetical protein